MLLTQPYLNILLQFSANILLKVLINKFLFKQIKGHMLYKFDGKIEGEGGHFAVPVSREAFYQLRILSPSSFSIDFHINIVHTVTDVWSLIHCTVEPRFNNPLRYNDIPGL